MGARQVEPRFQLVSCQVAASHWHHLEAVGRAGPRMSYPRPIPSSESSNAQRGQRANLPVGMAGVCVWHAERRGCSQLSPDAASATAASGCFAIVGPSKSFFPFLFAYTSISYPIAQEPFFRVDRALRKSKDFSSYSTQRKAPEVKEAGTGGYFDKLAPLMVCSMSPRNHVHYTRQSVSEWDE